MVESSERLKKLPPYLFAGLEKLISEKRKKGKEVISLSIGDPDIPTPLVIREALAKAAMDEKLHNYSSSDGEEFFKEAVIGFMKNRFKVDVGPKQVCSLMGSKEGIANIARAYVNPGDIVLAPDPAYPVYGQGATTLCDGVVKKMPLLAENGFLPDLGAIEVTPRTKMIYANYPNNPTGAIASEQFMKELAELADSKDLIVCFDNAYSEFTFDDYSAPSILEYTDNAVEFISLSKMYSMTGDRMGFAVGREDIVQGLTKIKNQIDSGNPPYVQKAAAVGLGLYKSSSRPKEVQDIMDEYELRRNYFVKELQRMGFGIELPKATFYLWVGLREGDGSSKEFVENTARKGVVFTPGNGFGQFGEGYFRVALTKGLDKLKRAVELVGSV